MKDQILKNIAATGADTVGGLVDGKVKVLAVVESYFETRKEVLKARYEQDIEAVDAAEGQILGMVGHEYSELTAVAGALFGLPVVDAPAGVVDTEAALNTAIDNQGNGSVVVAIDPAAKEAPSAVVTESLVVVGENKNEVLVVGAG